MSPGALAWMIVFAVAALAFFGIAVIVVVKGFADLKGLLHLTGEKAPNDGP